jgi:phosphatidylserine/phosphatidylglycerophosphate/cardiolipin synthase-like enzyme
MAFSFAIGSASGKITNNAPMEIARKLVEIKEKLGKKISIRFFVEGLRETSFRNHVTANYLKKAGIQIKFGSTHAKGFCIDGRYVLFGSTNLTNQSIMKNNEANLLIDDKKAAKVFLKYFDHLWRGGKHGGVKLLSPFVPDGKFKDLIIAMINQAEKRIDFAIYFFNHKEIENSLIAAHERGVKVTGFVHQHRSFALSYIHKNRATVRRMKVAGMMNLYFSVPTKFSHSKYIVVDKKMIALGTGNWLLEDVLIHPQLYLYLEDPVLAKALLKHLTYQINHQSSPAIAL